MLNFYPVGHWMLNFDVSMVKYENEHVGYDRQTAYDHYRAEVDADLGH